MGLVWSERRWYMAACHGQCVCARFWGLDESLPQTAKENSSFTFHYSKNQRSITNFSEGFSFDWLVKVMHNIYRTVLIKLILMICSIYYGKSGFPSSQIKMSTWMPPKVEFLRLRSQEILTEFKIQNAGTLHNHLAKAVVLYSLLAFLSISHTHRTVSYLRSYWYSVFMC